jgi:hypothetical protein
MRLLNATTWPLQFEVFYGNPPPYAILSHTWGSENEEVHSKTSEVEIELENASLGTRR